MPLLIFIDFTDNFMEKMDLKKRKTNKIHIYVIF